MSEPLLDGTSDPLTPYSDLVTTGGDASSSTDGVAGVDSGGGDPAQVHQLSQQAWDKMHPVDDNMEQVDGATTASSGQGGGGASGLPVPQIDDNLGSKDFGNPKGGNYVTDDANTARTIVNVAKSLLGRPYVWGGEDPSGVDCSGLVQYAYRQAGIEMPRLSYDQMWKGKVVDYKHLKPGDLVGWNNSTRFPGADHIAIYIGNNQIIEAPRPGLSVRVSGLYDYDVGEMWAVRIPGKRVPPTATPRAPRSTPKTAGTTRAVSRATADHHATKLASLN